MKNGPYQVCFFLNFKLINILFLNNFFYETSKVFVVMFLKGAGLDSLFKIIHTILMYYTVFHASGKLPVDAMTNFLIAGAKGVLDEPGHFDLCISSKPPSRIFQGQYCSVFLSTIPVTQPLLFNGSASFKQSVDKEIFKNPRMTVATKKWNVFVHDNSTDLIIGFCLPSSCSTHDLQVAIAYEIGRTTFQLKNNPETYILYSLATATHESYCHTENKIQEQSSLDGLSISFL